MQKFLHRLAVMFALFGLVFVPAACTGASDTPVPGNTTPALDYLPDIHRVEMLSDAFSEAELAIAHALDAGTLTANDASVTVDDNTDRKAITITQVQGNEFRLEGPIKGDTSLWVVTFGGRSSTLPGTGIKTEGDVRAHDAAALAALQEFLADIG